MRGCGLVSLVAVFSDAPGETGESGETGETGETGEPWLAELTDDEIVQPEK